MRWGKGLFIGGALGALAMAFILGTRLQPEEPNLAGRSGYEEQSASYRADGADCDPARLGRLAAGQRERKADACAEAQEQHREATNNLIEARRAADAADAAVVMAYQQARIEAWGAALGLLTLLAAIAAAAFAERAALHTKRSADAAHDANRPWVRMDVQQRAVRWLESDLLELKLDVRLKNMGRGPALDVWFETAIAFDMVTLALLEPELPKREPTKDHVRTIIFPDSEEQKWPVEAKRGDLPEKATVYLLVMCIYRAPAETRWRYSSEILEVDPHSDAERFYGREGNEMDLRMDPNHRDMKPVTVKRVRGLQPRMT